MTNEIYFSLSIFRPEINVQDEHAVINVAKKSQTC